MSLIYRDYKYLAHKKDIDWGWLVVLIVLVLLLMSDPANAEIATTQSKNPWTLSQCDRLTGQRAQAVFNVSTWNKGGFPLWRVTCLWRNP